MTDALNDPWRETVRDIFDMLILSASPATPLEQRILATIEARHHAYFCGLKTMAEWQQEDRI